MNKRVAIIVIVGLGLLALMIVIAAVIVFSGKADEETGATPAPQSTSSASPDVLPLSKQADPPTHDGLNEQVLDNHDAEVAANPILRALPHETNYWKATYGGVDNGKYVVKAAVYINTGDNHVTFIEAQRPHIEAYIKSLGQPAGTYVIEYGVINVSRGGR